MEKYINDILTHYLIACLWSSTDSNDIPLDDQYSIDDISSESKSKAVADITKFLTLAGEATDDISSESIGHDFWLTRCGHGAGFWDRGYTEVIELKLMQAVENFPNVDAVIGDDNLIYLE